MPDPIELIRRLDGLWVPAVAVASLVLLLILWEVAILLGVHVVLRKGEHPGVD